MKTVAWGECIYSSIYLYTLKTLFHFSQLNFKLICRLISFCIYTAILEQLSILLINSFKFFLRFPYIFEKAALIFLIMLRLKYPLPYYLQVIHLSLNVPFVYFAFFKYVRHTCICSVMSFRHTHIFFLKKKKKSILLKSILGFLSFKKRYLYDNIKL